MEWFNGMFDELKEVKYSKETTNFKEFCKVKYFKERMVLK